MAVAYSKLTRNLKFDADGAKPLAVPQQNWQGVNYVDEASAMQPIQVPYAKNVDLGDPIGGAKKRDGTELLFASLGSGGMKGLHCWKHSSGDILLGAWGTVLYNLAGGSGSIAKTSQADWQAGTITDIETGSSPGDMKLCRNYSATATATADFSGTHTNTVAAADKVELQGTAASTEVSQTSSNNFGYLGYSGAGEWKGQRFKATANLNGVSQLGIEIKSNGFGGTSPAVRVHVFSDSSGNVGSSISTTGYAAIASGAWPATGNYATVTVTLDSSLVSNTYYWVVCQPQSGDASNYAKWALQDTDVYGDGYAAYSNNGGSSWSNQTTYDYAFKINFLGSYSTSGTYTHVAQDVSGAGQVGTATMAFNVTTPAGTTITVYVRISTDGGSTWGSWAAKNSGDTIIAADTILSSYRVQWKAEFVTTDTTKTPSLLDVTVAVTARSQTAGNWVSPTLDLTNTPLTATLSWTQTTPANTSAEWQTRVSDNGTDWGDYRTINASGDGIPLGRYAQIKIVLTGTAAATPTISDFTVAYTTSYTTATSIKTGLSGNRVRFADYSPKDYCIFCDGGRPQIVYKDGTGTVTVRNAGVDPPASAPTIADGGAGSLTGTYYGKVTYVNDDGAESNASSASGSLVITSKQIAWSGIPTGPAGTASRKLYRTKAGGSVYYLIATIEDNTTATYTDTTADTALTTLMEDDNNIPPGAKIVFEFMNYMFYVAADDESQLWFAKVGQPEQVPNIATSMFFKSMPGAILGIEATHNALVVGGEDFVDPIIATSVGHIFDSDPTVDTTIVKHIDKAGALSHESIKMCVDPELRQIMIFPTVTGVRFLLPGLQENSLESVPLSRNMQTYYDQAVNRHNMAAAFFNNRYILSFTWQEPGAATATANNVIFVYDFRSKQWYGPWTIGASCFAIAGKELYCGDAAAGKVYKMFSGSSDAGSAIEMILDLPMVAPAGLQGTCRFTRFLMEVSADSVTTSTVVKPKVDDREASISLGTLTSAFTGDERPGHNTIRSRKYAIPLAQGHALSHRIVDNSTNPLTIHKVITEYEVVPVRT